MHSISKLWIKDWIRKSRTNTSRTEERHFEYIMNIQHRIFAKWKTSANKFSRLWYALNAVADMCSLSVCFVTDGLNWRERGKNIWATGLWILEASLSSLPFPPLLPCSSLQSTRMLTWASAVQRHIHSLLFPSLFIPIFSLFCGFEIPIRRILQKKFLRYSQCIKIESEISSFPLRLCRQETLKNSVCDLRRFRSHSVHF
jgi:hypothetical protein